MNIELRPKDVFKKILYLILFLLSANILGIVSRHYLDHGYVYGLVPLFDFNTEKNVPTLYSSVALVFSSVLLSFIAVIHKRLGLSYIPWVGLSLIFLFLSIDEISLIHERLGKATKEVFQPTGLLFFAWVIPYGMGLFVFVIVYAKFLFKLPKSTMVFFLISGSTFISGAIGIEMLSAREAELYGDSILYAFFYTCEEFLEMLGIAIFIYTLLTYIENQFGYISITLTKNTSWSTAAHSDNAYQH